jgi:hypothetical protein
MRFGLVRLIFKKSYKPYPTNAVRIGSVVKVYGITFQYQAILNIQKNNLNILNNITIQINIVYQK